LSFYIFCFFLFGLIKLIFVLCGALHALLPPAIGVLLRGPKHGAEKKVELKMGALGEKGKREWEGRVFEGKNWNKLGGGTVVPLRIPSAEPDLRMSIQGNLWTSFLMLKQRR